MAALPRPIESHEVAGRVTREAAAATGLAAGTPVVGGMFDIDAVADRRRASSTRARWAGHRRHVGHQRGRDARSRIIDKRLLHETLFAVPGLWLTIDGSATSATNLEWFVTQLLRRRT